MRIFVLKSISLIIKNLLWQLAKFRRLILNPLKGWSDSSGQPFATL